MKIVLESGHIITGLLVALCLMSGLDLWRQYAINDIDYWFGRYIDEVKQSSKTWSMAYRLEELEIKLEDQQKILDQASLEINQHLPQNSKIGDKALRTSMHDFVYTRQSRIAIHSLIHNDSAIVEIACGDDRGPLLRIGQTDFRTDPRDACQVFSASGSAISGPQSMFEMINLEEDTFALRSIANDLFLRAKPPPIDSPNLPWTLVVGGPLAGAAERFRYTSGGYLYSPLMGGFFVCSDKNMKVTGYSGKYGSFSKFKIRPVSDKSSRNAQALVRLSSQIINIENKYINQFPVRNKKTSPDSASPDLSTTKICIAVPVTSKGTVMKTIQDSPFWSNIFDSFMKSIDWKSNKYVFKFFMGFDKADPLYDTGDSWNDIRKEFEKRALYRLKEQMIDEESGRNLLKDFLSIKLMHFEHLEGAPTQVVSQLVLTAFGEGFDYFYQVNDDTIIVTPNWTPQLIDNLLNNPLIPNFGVTGPLDTNNDLIFTHAFVHRTHIEIFGHLFPPYFKNWWSDDWISTVYGRDHTIKNNDVQIKHNVGSQKEHGYTRYDVDMSAQLKLDGELLKGFVQIDQWLKKSGLPRLSLPDVCGYIPLVRHIGAALEGTPSSAETDKHIIGN